MQEASEGKYCKTKWKVLQDKKGSVEVPHSDQDLPGNDTPDSFEYLLCCFEMLGGLDNQC